MADRAHSLYRKVYRVLRGRILSGDYEPGAQIETESRLTGQLGASVITIRQAEQMLVDEGLLVKQQGRGTFVPEAVRRRLKILCVCGLDLADGLQHQMGSYYSDLIVLSQQEAARRGLEFEAVWLARADPDHAQRYCEDSSIQEFWGFVFIACGPNHPLLRCVHARRRRYVTISSHEDKGFRRVWLDYREAIRLALAVFKDRPKPPPLVVGIDNLKATVESVVEAQGLRIPQVYVSGWKPRVSFETAGYLRALELIREGRDLSRLILLDDVVAQGVTRALLKSGYAERDVRLAVICDRPTMPLGFEATYIVHDTRDEVQHAFEILELPKDAGKTATEWRGGFRVAAAAEADPERGG